MGAGLATKAASALLFLGPLAGCILIAPRYDPQPNCKITGASPCGDCLRQHCQTEINGCCGSDACSGGILSSISDDDSGSTMAALDTCAGGDKSRCSSQLQYARESNEGNAVTTCLANQCRDLCADSTSALAKWTCSTPRDTTDECSACIYGKCEAKVDACCAPATDGALHGTTCESLVSTDMAACTGKDAPRCAGIPGESTSGLDGAVRGCIADACATACFGTGRQHQRCTLEGSGGYCLCTKASVKSGDECSTTTIAKGRCFFDDSGDCTCGHYACALDVDSITNEASCVCSLQNKKNGTGSAAECNPDLVARATPTTTAKGQCCLQGTICTCTTKDYLGACPGTPIDSCDADFVLDELASGKTDSCSQ